MRRDDHVVTRAATGSRGGKLVEDRCTWARVGTAAGATPAAVRTPRVQFGKKLEGMAQPPPRGRAGTRHRTQGAEEWRAGARAGANAATHRAVAAQIRGLPRQRARDLGPTPASRRGCGPKFRRVNKRQGRWVGVAAQQDGDGSARARGLNGRSAALPKKGGSRQALSSTGGLLEQHRRSSRPPRRLRRDVPEESGFCGTLHPSKPHQVANYSDPGPSEEGCAGFRG